MIATQLAFAGRAFLETNARELSRANWSFPEGAAFEQRLAESADELEREYVRLFLDPGGAPCPPWQSAHEEDGQLMGLAHRSAMAWYSKYGVAPKVESEPADHVGLLLTFYAQLAGSDAPAEELKLFAQRHLSWIPEFAGKVASEARVPFYKELGAFTAATVRAVLRS